MKKTISVLVVLFFVFSATLGFSEVKKGVINLKLGVNSATITNMSYEGITDDYFKKRTGFFFGVGFDLKYNENLTFQPELLYTQKGVKFEYNYTESGAQAKLNSTISLSYLEIPMLIKYKIPTEGLNISVYGGPYVAKRVSSKIKTEVKLSYEGETLADETDTEDISDDIKGTDMGIVFGVEGMAPIMGYKALIGIRYVAGMVDINANATGTEPSSKNSVIAFYCGVVF